jgi:hypothetical protein
MHRFDPHGRERLLEIFIEASPFAVQAPNASTAIIKI